jgi:hypothetical protein
MKKSDAARPKKSRTRPFESSLPWFRLYTEFASDPKTQMLSEVLQRRFVMILCLTGSRLVPTSDDAAIAFAMRIGGDELASTKRSLVDAGLIRSDWLPVAWSRRQFHSDHSGAERKRQQRSRDRQRDRHVEVTAGSHDSPGLEGEERRGEQNRSRGEGANPVDNSRNDSDGTAPRSFSLKSLTPKNRTPRNGRSAGPFEAINDAVEKLIVAGISASDVAGLAKCAHVTPKQAAAAVKQLRDRGRLQ